MAKIKNGFPGSLSGKVGNVVFVQRGDTFYMRSVPAKTVNPRSPAQQANRRLFGLSSSLAAKLAPFLAISLQSVPDKTPRGAFISLNKNTAIIHDEDIPVIRYPKLILSAGTLPPPHSLSVFREQLGLLRLNWKNPDFSTTSARQNDTLLFLALVPDTHERFFIIHGPERHENRYEVSVPESLHNHPLHVYALARSANGKKFSETVYAGLV